MRKLVSHEKDMLIMWMLTHMTSEQRRQLMGELPSIYKILYPSVSDETLALRMTQRIRQVEGQSDIIPHNVNL